MLASFLNSLRHTFDLRWGDKGSLVYLACTSPSLLLMPSLSGPRYTHYSAHRVLRQFSFNQDIPPMFKEVVPYLPSLDPFLRLQAFSYWWEEGPSSWCQTPSGGSLLSVALLVTRKGFKSPFWILLVLTRLEGFLISISSLLLLITSVWPSLLLVLCLLQ